MAPWDLSQNDGFGGDLPDPNLIREQQQQQQQYRPPSPSPAPVWNEPLPTRDNRKRQGDQILEVAIRKAEKLPPPPKGMKKGGPIKCVCEIKNRSDCRIETGPCSNGSVTNPVWGNDPEHYRGHLQGWSEGDTLIFAIQQENGLGWRTLCTAELPAKDYSGKAGYEWWLPLRFENDKGELPDQMQKDYPEGYPYAAVLVKVQLVQGVDLAQDWNLGAAPLKEKEGGCWTRCVQSWCVICCCRHCTNCWNVFWTRLKQGCTIFVLGWGIFCCMGCHKLCTMTWSWCTGKESLRELRQSCAKQYHLPDADDDLDEAPDTACCCIPLRTAVFMISVLSTINALQAFFFPQFLMGTSTRYCGGYGVTSRLVVGGTQIAGLFFGPVGAFGALELSVSLLNMYNYFQLLRLGGMIVMLYIDIPLLADCSIWRTDINAAIKEHGWNPAMYNVAMGNSCLQAQIDFAIGTAFHLCMYVYLVSLTRRLIWDTEQTPRYLLQMPRELPNGAFVKHSRTQGRAKPPYGAIQDVLSQSQMEEEVIPKGKLEKAPSNPHMSAVPWEKNLERSYIPMPLPREMMAPLPGGRPQRGVWHPNAMPAPPGMIPPRMAPMPPGMEWMGPGIPIGPPRPAVGPGGMGQQSPGFRY